MGESASAFPPANIASLCHPRVCTSSTRCSRQSSSSPWWPLAWEITHQPEATEPPAAAATTLPLATTLHRLATATTTREVTNLLTREATTSAPSLASSSRSSSSCSPPSSWPSCSPPCCSQASASTSLRTRSTSSPTSSTKLWNLSQVLRTLRKRRSTERDLVTGGLVVGYSLARDIIKTPPPPQKQRSRISTFPCATKIAKPGDDDGLVGIYFLIYCLFITWPILQNTTMFSHLFFIRTADLHLIRPFPAAFYEGD